MSTTSTIRHGFTLVELLIVIAILGVVVGLTVPAITLVKANAQSTSCASNQRQMITAILAYVNERKGQLPQVDFVSGRDWPSAGQPNPLYELLEGRELAIEDDLKPLVNSQQYSLNEVDLMNRLPVTQCPAVRVIFKTQRIASLPGVRPQLARPNYVSSRNGAPYADLNQWGTTPGSAGYLRRLTMVQQPGRMGFVFCANFRLDRHGVDLPANPLTDPASPFPVHFVRKEPQYRTVASYGTAFDITDRDLYQGRVNVAYLDGRVAGLGHAIDPITFVSLGGNDRLLPAANPRTTGSDYRHFLRGGH